MNQEKKQESINFINRLGVIGNIICAFVGKVYFYVVGVLFAIITLWLLGVNIFSTSYMIADATEHTYYSADKPWFNLLMLLAFCGVLLGIYKTKLFASFKAKLEDDNFFKRCRRFLILLLLIEGLLVAFSLLCIPRADQKYVMDMVYKLQVKEYDMFEPGGYVEKFPFQINLILPFYALSSIFGINNYIFFQIINVIALIIIYKSLENIVEHFEAGRLSRLMIYFYGVLFFPLIFYVVFVYGNIIGLAFALLAIFYEIRLLDREKIFEKTNILQLCRDMILSALFIVLAIMMKSLYLIFLIGMIIYALVKMIKDKKIFPVGLFIFIAAFYFVQNISFNMYIENVSGMVLEGGMNSWAGIAEGLQDNEIRANGWYNGYGNYTYQKNEYDPERQAEEVKEYVEERLEYFSDNKDEALEFFVEKNASQWNNPTFQCLWIIQTMGTQNVPPMWIRRIVSIDGSYVFYRLLDFLQMITLFGACLYLFICKNKSNYGYLFLEMIIIGGFVFHTVWEAKGQYTILYYILFIPIAIKGYSGYVNKYNIPVFKGHTGSKKDVILISENHTKRLKAWIGLTKIVLFTTAGVLLFSLNDNLNAIVNTDMDTEEYAQYVERHRYDNIKDGIYRIHPAKDVSMSITVGNTEDANRGIVYMSESDSEDSEVKVRTIYDRVYIQFPSNTLYLDLYNNNEDEGAYVSAYKANYGRAQQWGLKETGTGSYYLRVGVKSALTYDEDSKSVMVKEFDYLDSQEWILKRVDE